MTLSRIVRAAAVCVLALAACTEEAPKLAAPPTVEKAPAPAPVAGAKVPGPTADPNRALVDRVRGALVRERGLPADDIDVSASGGVVSLWGRVSSDKERQRAAEVAGAVEGVQRIENKLMIEGS